GSMDHLRREGMSLRDAVITAGPVRLRPIIMTTMAPVVGAIPLAIGVGPGAETRAPLARSIIGGSILSTLVTLLIVPVFYVIFDRAGGWLRAQLRNEPPSHREHRETKHRDEIEMNEPIPVLANGNGVAHSSSAVSSSPN